MTPLLIIAGVIAFLAAWTYFMVKLSGRPWWNPLWTAFTLTAVALLYGLGGLIGYDIPRHNPFIGRRAEFVGHVVWPQVQMAAAFALGSVFFWWQGLRRLSDAPRPDKRVRA
jgi:hypothetical protein